MSKNEREIQRRVRNMAVNRDGSCLAWNSLVYTSHLPGKMVLPLTDEIALVREAVTMKHSVDTYGCAGYQGTSRIFSIRGSRHSLTTIEIRLQDGVWILAQVKGPSNRLVEQELEDIAKHVTDAYNAAWTKTEPTKRHFGWRKPMSVKASAS